MEEWTSAEIEQRIKWKAPFAVFWYTPFCGTCKMGERMLNIVEETDLIIPVYRCNVNFAPRLVKQWKIESIPCLTVIRGGQIARQQYAMHSVDYLYKLLKK